MKRILVLLLLIMSHFTNAAPYKEYSQDELQGMFGLENEKGEYIVDLNIPELIEITKSLEQHAINYPVLFDQDADRKLAVRDAVYLTNVMDILFPSFENNLLLLNLTLRLNNVSYNLNAQPELSNERLNKAADAIFKLEPDNTETHYRLGFFLASSNRLEESIPHLEKAAENGVIDANYSLAMVYLSQEKFDKALEYLAVYKENSPENQEINDLIEAIKSGELKIEKKSTEDLPVTSENTQTDVKAGEK